MAVQPPSFQAKCAAELLLCLCVPSSCLLAMVLIPHAPPPLPVQTTGNGESGLLVSFPVGSYWGCLRTVPSCTSPVGSYWGCPTWGSSHAPPVGSYWEGDHETIPAGFDWPWGQGIPSGSRRQGPKHLALWPRRAPPEGPPSHSDTPLGRIPAGSQHQRCTSCSWSSLLQSATPAGSIRAATVRSSPQMGTGDVDWGGLPAGPRQVTQEPAPPFPLCPCWH